MKTADSLKYSLLKISRNKKNIYFIFLLIISTLILLLTLTFHTFYFRNLDDSFNKNIYSKSLAVFPNTEDLIKYGVDYDYNFEQILNIKHVLEIYNSSHGVADVEVLKYKNNVYNGIVSLVYGSINTLPKNIIGKTINENDTGVAICPTLFYPGYASSLYNNDQKYIDGKEILNTSFDVDLDIWTQVDGKIKKTGEQYKKTFKITGLYETKETLMTPNTCYISAKDIIELSTTILGDSNARSLSGTVVIVDSRENIDYVMKEISNLGFMVETQSGIDDGLIATIKIICWGIVGIVILALTMLSILYVKKKVINNSVDIGLLKTIGFRNGEIKKINTFQILYISFVSYIIGLVIFEIIIIFINIFYKNFLIYNNVIIYKSFTSYIVAFSIILLIPVIIDYLFINKKVNENTVILIKGKKI